MISEMTLEIISEMTFFRSVRTESSCRSRCGIVPHEFDLPRQRFSKPLASLFVWGSDRRVASVRDFDSASL